MNIKNCELASSHIAQWIGAYASHHGKKALVVGLTNDPSSMLTALLCSKVGAHTKTIMDVVPRTICVHMTASSKSVKAKRLTDFVGSYRIGKLEVIPKPNEPIMAEGFDLYPGGYPLEDEPTEEERVIPIPHSDVEQQANYSKAAMAAVLAHYADVNDGLVVGTVTSTQGILQRSHRKYGNGAADIFPLLDLHDSEVRELAQHWKFEANSSIFPPSIEEDDVEWAQRENERRTATKGTAIFGGPRQPQQHPLWYKYTGPQKQVISELWARERKTRHKSLLDKPYCQLRQIEGLFAQ